MKWYQIFGFTVNIIAALYYLYMSALHVFVYLMNKKEGHFVNFHEGKISISIATILSVLTALAWYAFKNPGTLKLGNMLLFIPLGLLVAYGIFAIFLIVGSGGKWN